MNTLFKNILINLVAIFFVVGGVVIADKLVPTASVPLISNYYTLNDIYQKLTTPGYVSAGHDLKPTVATNAVSMPSLEEIYNAIPPHKTVSSSTVSIEAGIYDQTNLAQVDTDLVSGNIKASTTILGVTGSLLCQ